MSIWTKITESLSRHFSHEELRRKATTLHHFNVIEISIIIFFCWQAYDLLQWYKSIVTPENFSGASFWAAIGGIVAAIFGASKHMNETFKKKE